MLGEVEATDVWRRLAFDVDACDLFDSIELAAKWERTAYNVGGIPVAEKSVSVTLTPREGASVVALLDVVTSTLGHHDNFGRPGTAGFDAKMDENGRVVIA